MLIVILEFFEKKVKIFSKLGKKGEKIGKNKEKGCSIDDTRLRGHKLSIDD